MSIDAEKEGDDLTKVVRTRWKEAGPLSSFHDRGGAA